MSKWNGWRGWNARGELLYCSLFLQIARYIGILISWSDPENNLVFKIRNLCTFRIRLWKENEEEGAF